MIQFESVSKIYNENTRRNKSLRDVFSFNKKIRPEGEGKFIAVDDVSFSVDKGEAIAIVGHNGAGKSTLLKLLTRIILPTKGSIKINGTLSSLLEVGTGFHHELSGYENIFLSGAILGMNRHDVKKKLNEIIDFSEIEKFIDLPVKFYSSGMYLRLAFSIGVHLDSDILVIDEALAVGDVSFQNKCMDKINKIKKEGKTIVLVSHAEQQVIDLCSRCLVMDHGKLIFSGETVQALDIYRKII